MRLSITVGGLLVMWKYVSISKHRQQHMHPQIYTIPTFTTRGLPSTQWLFYNTPTGAQTYILRRFRAMSDYNIVVVTKVYTLLGNWYSDSRVCSLSFLSNGSPGFLKGIFWTLASFSSIFSCLIDTLAKNLFKIVFLGTVTSSLSYKCIICSCFISWMIPSNLTRHFTFAFFTPLDPLPLIFSPVLV